MSGMKFQNGPLQFSVNGISTQRSAKYINQESTQSVLPAFTREANEHLSLAWSKAEDLVILEMVLIRQMHPEKSEICWQGIADALICRGYGDRHPTGGLVKSRFYSIMCRALRPTPLDTQKMCDRIAILYHDEFAAAQKLKRKRVNVMTSSKGVPTEAGKVPEVEIAIGCADSRLHDKKSALRAIDQASLKGHLEQALGIHHSQRPDVVAHKRQSESVRTQQSQSTQIIPNSQPMRSRSQSLRVHQLPSPPPSSDTIEPTSSQDSKTNQTSFTSTPPESRKSVNYSANRPISRKKSTLTHTDFSSSSQTISTPVQTTMLSEPYPDLYTELQTLLRGEALGAAKSRDEHTKATLEKKCKAPKGKLIFHSANYKHSRNKREKCFIVHSMLESEMSKAMQNLKEIANPAADPAQKVDRKRQMRKTRKHSHSHQEDLCPSLSNDQQTPKRIRITSTPKLTSGQIESAHRQKRKRRKLKEKRARIAAEKQQAPVTDSSESAERFISLSPDPEGEKTESSLFEDLVPGSQIYARLTELRERIRRKSLSAKSPDIDIMDFAENKKRDIVQDVMDRVTKNRETRVAKVNSAVEVYFSSSQTSDHR